MHTTALRKVGGSVMLAVPPAVLDLLELKPGSVVGLEIEDQHLVIRPQTKPRYTLGELLSQFNPEAPLSEEEREWIEIKPAGKEL